MRTETRTVRIGELLGQIDWDYDFASHGWDRGSSMNPESLATAVDKLRQLDEGLGRGERWEATTDGGVPRVGWGEVVAIGMYDGWPHWKPIPSVCIAGTLGAEWSGFYILSDIRRASGDA